VALVGLVELLRGEASDGPRLLDVQWATDHLVSLGAVEVARPTYLDLLAQALQSPQPEFVAGRRATSPPGPRSSGVGC
jgi:leucyl/phenylalanyl-tRNA--protein transferase